MPDIVVGGNRTTLQNIADAHDASVGGDVGRRPSSGGGASKRGSSTHSGDGAAVAFVVTHNAPFTPTKVLALTPRTAAASALHSVTAITATNFTITFAVAPANAANNVKFDWEVGK